ncbi:hypothetical protein D3C73_1638280 [compost metagenome]
MVVVGAIFVSRKLVIWLDSVVVGMVLRTIGSFLSVAISISSSGTGKPRVTRMQGVSSDSHSLASRSLR